MSVKESGNKTALTKDFNKDAIQQVIARVSVNAVGIDEIVAALVAEYCGSLDEYMKFIQDLLNSIDPPTPEELDDVLLKLCPLVYFTSDAQETLGIREDVAKAVKIEKYSNAYAKTNGTIPSREAEAELECQAEFIVHLAYSRAYRKVKERLTAAYEMIVSIKKVISRRMGEREFGNVDPNRYN